MNEGITYEKYIICPYCGCRNDEDDEHESREIECDECGERFKMEIEYDISYSTYKLED
jgi:transcription elongation factor Elf1